MFFLTVLETVAVGRMFNPEHVDNSCQIEFRKKCLGFSTRIEDLLPALYSNKEYNLAVLEEISPGIEQEPVMERWYIQNFASKWVEYVPTPEKRTPIALNKHYLGFNSFALE